MIDSQDPIFYAVMINGRSLKRWQAETIQKLDESGLCRCILFISNPDNINKKKSFIGKLLNRHLLFNFLLNRTFRVEAEKPEELPLGVAVIEVPPITAGFTHSFNPEEIQKIRTHSPLFILRFGYNILRGDILDATPFGIWSFHHGDERKFRGGPFGFHEIRLKTPVSGVILQKLTPRLDAGHVMLRREYITVNHSWKEMRQRLLAENTDMPLLAVKKYILQKEILPVPSASKARIYKAPGMFSMLWFMLLLGWRRIAFHFQRLFVYESWHVESGLTYNSPLVPVLPTVTTVSSSAAGEFHADPFILQAADNLVVLSEHFSYGRRLGCISASVPGQETYQWMSSKSHLAYPYVFCHHGENWVIPENAESGKCVAFHVDNKLNINEEVVLLDLPAIDPSLVVHEGRFYLFCGLKGQLPNEKLFIFWSDAFEGPYRPHYLNPVKVTPVGSRPGGTMINWQGDLYRPAQVSDIYYGYKIQINKILKLSPEAFVEKEKSEINPAIFGSHYSGLHTYTVSGNHYAIDLKTHMVGLAAFIFRWKQKRLHRRSDV